MEEQVYSLKRYDFHLPKELIAQEPLEDRSGCRLMVVRGMGVEHAIFSDIVRYIPKGSLLLLNDTKVIPARLKGRKGSGGRVEVLLIRRIEGDGKVGEVYEGFVRGKNIRPGTNLALGSGLIEGTCLERIDGGRFKIHLHTSGGDLRKVISEVGLPPFPPYIKREDIPLSMYQTVYSRTEGAIAAPTAGLHFTKSLLRDLERKGVVTAYLTLHVGPGTFTPVRVDDVREHTMEGEHYTIPPATVKAYEAAVANGDEIFAVGTTTMRALEAAVNRDGEIERPSGIADIFIYPPYTFRSKVGAMITNFHIPKSTLIMMVSAFGGYNAVMKAYRLAVKARYRFYSFGDAMLLYRSQGSMVEGD